MTFANVCETSLSVVAKNRRTLLYVSNDNGQIMGKPLLLIKKQLLSKGSDIIECSHANVIK